MLLLLSKSVMLYINSSFTKMSKIKVTRSAKVKLNVYRGIQVTYKYVPENMSFLQYWLPMATFL